MKICIIATSEGKNLELARKFEENFLALNIASTILDVVKLELPLYSSLSERTNNPQDIVAPCRDLLQADGFVFLAPEYNGGPPPTFSNFLSWVSRSTKDWRENFSNKPAVIGTHSAGGGLNVLTIMRLQLAYLGLNVVGRQIHTTLQKPLDQASLDAVCEQLIKLCRKN